MADIAIFRINYKSDFILTLNSDAGWMTPFCIKFWTGAPSQAYFAGYDGTTYTNCAPVYGEPTKLLVQFDDHHLPIGDLKFQISYHFTVADFPTSVEDEAINQDSVIIEVDDAPAQVMLDLNGETAPEIEFSLPAYANEAQRIENEQQRIANEEQRIANEQTRIDNEALRISAEQTRQDNEAQRIRNEHTRINQEEARVREFATLKRDAQEATTAANDAAALANQKAQLAADKAQLAADKAALAQDAANLANQKAQLAADKAALAQDAADLANQKAQLAQQKAEYAQTQGDYAKQQGDYAKEQGDYAKRKGDDAATQMQQQAQAFSEAQAARQTSYEQAEGTESGSVAGDGSRWGAFKTNEAARDAKVDAKVADITNLQEAVAEGAVYDVSAKNPTAGPNNDGKWGSLSALLSDANLNTLIPSAVRRGGMSIKFVLTSDNNYVQYRYMSSSTAVADFTNVASWQGVDDEPVTGSNNLVESGSLAPIYNSFEFNAAEDLAKEMSWSIVYNENSGFTGASYSNGTVIVNHNHNGNDRCTFFIGNIPSGKTYVVEIDSAEGLASTAPLQITQNSSESSAGDNPISIVTDSETGKLKGEIRSTGANYYFLVKAKYNSSSVVLSGFTIKEKDAKDANIIKREALPDQVNYAADHFASLEGEVNTLDQNETIETQYRTCELFNSFSFNGEDSDDGYYITSWNQVYFRGSGIYGTATTLANLKTALNKEDYDIAPSGANAILIPIDKKLVLRNGTFQIVNNSTFDITDRTLLYVTSAGVVGGEMADIDGRRIKKGSVGNEQFSPEATIPDYLTRNILEVESGEIPTITFPYVGEWFINENGVKTTSSNWTVSSIFLLRAGQHLTFNFSATGGGRPLMCLADSTDPDTANFTVVITGTSTIQEYTYYAEVDCYVLLQYYRKTGDPFVSIDSPRIKRIEDQISLTTLPDYIKEETGRVYRQLRSNIQGNRMLVAFNTDQHISRDVTSENDGTNPVFTLHGLQSIVELAEKLPIDLIVLGGDAAGYDNVVSNTVDGIIDEVNLLNQPFSFINIPSISLPGNHDAYQNNNNMTAQGMYNSNFKRSKWIKGLVHSGNDNCDSYVDDSDNKVRLIFIDTYSTNVRTENFATFLENALSTMPEGYNAIIFSHNPLTNEFAGLIKKYSSPTDETGSDAFTGPSDQHTLLDAYAERIIACICGHSHTDAYGISSSGILYIETTSAVHTRRIFRDGDVTVPYSGVLNSAKETAYDIFVINLDSQTIEAVRFGQGSNRLWKYKGTGQGLLSYKNCINGVASVPSAELVFTNDSDNTDVVSVTANSQGFYEVYLSLGATYTISCTGYTLDVNSVEVTENKVVDIEMTVNT